MPRILTYALIMALAFSASACGRKAALEAPTAAPPANGEKAPPAEPKEDKPFIRDGLIQ